MSRLDRLALRTAVVALAGVSALGLAAETASAKCDLTFSAGPRTVHAGGQIHLKGSGDSDDYFFKRFCVQQRTAHHAWRNVKCARGATDSGGRVDTRVRATHKGTYQFRGVLFEAWKNHLEPGPISDVYTVTVR